MDESLDVKNVDDEGFRLIGRRGFVKALSIAALLATGMPQIANAIVPQPFEVTQIGGFSYSDRHNWALYGWGRDFLNAAYGGGRNDLDLGLVNERKRLFHIDAHHDTTYDSDGLIFFNSANFYEGFLSNDISYEEKLEGLQKETYETSIGMFVSKAFALGIFDEMFWVRPRWDLARDSDLGEKKYRLEDVHNGIPTFKSFKLVEVPVDYEGDERVLTINSITADQIPQYANSGLDIFDFDFDYLSCSGQGRPAWWSIDNFNSEAREKYLKINEVVDGKIRNPYSPIYEASLDEIDSSIAEIEDVLKTLSDPLSLTAALSRSFLFRDQVDYIDDAFRSMV
jgi:hypothetical protein